eukprot:761808-Hanusia_phi.AAC.3
MGEKHRGVVSDKTLDGGRSVENEDLCDLGGGLVEKDETRGETRCVGHVGSRCTECGGKHEHPYMLIE